MRAIGLLLVLISAVLCAAVEPLPGTHSSKPKKLSFRIVGITEKIPKSGFSSNRDVFVATVVDKKGKTNWAKIVYRYLGYEDSFPDRLLSPDLLHEFLAVREPSCDESLASLGTKTITATDGRLSSVNILRYTTSEAAVESAGEQQLPCFVVQPRAYRGSRPIKASGAMTQHSEGE